RDVDALRFLADHVIARHDPEAARSDRPYRALLDAVIARQAELVARWQLIGFIHGVMNTDNMSIAGETIDYGPCAFMDAYHPDTVYSSIDHMGRYAYANQPPIAHWNLANFAQTLLPLLGEQEDESLAEAQEAVNAFPELFETAYLAGLRVKLGLLEAREGDLELARDLLNRMAENGADFTLTFRRLCDAAGGAPQSDAPVRTLFDDPTVFESWATRWRQRLAQESAGDTERQNAMRAVNPAFIPRNHLVEDVIKAAVDTEDFAPLDVLMTVLASPYDEQPAYARFAEPPRPEQMVRQTFCGT
ncbi:MAG: protein adenylyltransferase SelO family protein, partial [Methyloligellaceae bacterium]